MPRPAEEVREVDLGSHRTTVRISGPVDGVPVLCLHSLGLDHRSFDGLARELPTARLVRYDQRGHGTAADVAPEEITLDALARDAGRVRAAAGLDAAHLVGHSLGGAVAATALRADPGPWRSLAVLCSPPAGGETFAHRAADARARGRAAIVEPTLERWFTPRARAAGGPWVRYATERLTEMRLPQWVALWEALGTFPGYSLGSSPGSPDAGWPALPYAVLADADDASTPPARMATIARALPGARLTTLHGGGHLGPLVRPAEAGGVLRELWREDHDG